MINKLMQVTALITSIGNVQKLRHIQGQNETWKHQLERVVNAEVDKQQAIGDHGAALTIEEFIEAANVGLTVCRPWFRVFLNPHHEELLGTHVGVLRCVACGHMRVKV